MSSREIAEVVDSRHPDVCRTIERLIDKGAIARYTPTAYTHPQNKQTYQQFHINKRDSYVVVAQLSPEFTARLVDRWQELEGRNAVSIPQTLPEALRLAADLADQVEEQQKLIKEQKPAVEFVERYVETRSTKSMREVAKVLGVKERDFITQMEIEKILFRQSGNLLPFASYQHKGYFTVKTGESNGYAYQQTRFTPEGIAWISKRMGLIKDVA
ncbi:MAG: phage regulatory protein/antirepressor Ant [Neptuniibacter sp.]|nr:phage regulatory protein/antirepressor Ant [Neptuniibacter sp.]